MVREDSRVPHSSQQMPHTDQARLARVGALAAAGVLAGIGAKVADESAIGWLADAGTYPALWVLAFAVVARSAPDAGDAAATAAAFFAAMVAGYYGWAGLVLGFPQGSEPWYWLGIAIVAVPIGALVTWWALRSSAIVAAVVVGAVASLAVVNGASLRAARALTGDLPVTLVRPVQVVIEVVVTVVVLAVLPLQRRIRGWALAAWLPLVWLTPQVAGAVLGRLPLG